MLFEKKFLNETKNHNPPPPFKLNGRSLRPFGLLAPKTLIIGLSNLSILRVPEEGYSKNVRNRFDIYVFSTCLDYKWMEFFHRHLFHSKVSALFPFPTSAQYFSLICNPFADPIISLHSRDISLFDCHIMNALN